MKDFFSEKLQLLFEYQIRDEAWEALINNIHLCCYRETINAAEDVTHLKAIEKTLAVCLQQDYLEMLTDFYEQNSKTDDFDIYMDWSDEEKFNRQKFKEQFKVCGIYFRENADEFEVHVEDKDDAVFGGHLVYTDVTFNENNEKPFTLSGIEISG